MFAENKIDFLNPHSVEVITLNRKMHKVDFLPFKLWFYQDKSLFWISSFAHVLGNLGRWWCRILNFKTGKKSFLDCFKIFKA